MRLAFTRLAPMRLAPMRLAPMRLAFMRLAFTRLAFMRLASGARRDCKAFHAIFRNFRFKPRTSARGARGTTDTPNGRKTLVWSLKRKFPHIHGQRSPATRHAPPGAYARRAGINATRARRCGRGRAGINATRARRCGHGRTGILSVPARRRMGAWARGHARARARTATYGRLRAGTPPRANIKGQSRNPKNPFWENRNGFENSVRGPPTFYPGGRFFRLQGPGIVTIAH